MKKGYFLSGIMANTGFGKLIATYGEIKVAIPQKGINNRDGSLKANWHFRMKRLSIDDALWLYNRGAEITVA